MDIREQHCKIGAFAEAEGASHFLSRNVISAQIPLVSFRFVLAMFLHQETGQQALLSF
jgi:hypothetical protein